MERAEPKPDFGFLEDLPDLYTDIGESDNIVDWTLIAMWKTLLVILWSIFFPFFNPLFVLLAVFLFGVCLFPLFWLGLIPFGGYLVLAMLFWGIVTPEVLDQLGFWDKMNDLFGFDDSLILYGPPTGKPLN